MEELTQEQNPKIVKVLERAVDTWREFLTSDAEEPNETELLAAQILADEVVITLLEFPDETAEFYAKVRGKYGSMLEASDILKESLDDATTSEAV